MPIEVSGLFKLDVDDDIWQDVGLTDEHDEDGIVPAWLGNEIVWTGIKAMLQYERCLEEEKRLIGEKVSMYQWFWEEWVVATSAANRLEGEDAILYQVLERKEYLVRLYLAWTPCIGAIENQEGYSFDEWGPTIVEIENAKVYETTASTKKNRSRRNKNKYC